LTLIEAMANARPVVATAVGGVIDLLADGRGICVPSGDETAFAAALEKLAADRRLQKDLGARGLQYVERTHSKERLVEDIKSLYGELMNAEVTSELGKVSRKGAKALSEKTQS